MFGIVLNMGCKAFAVAWPNAILIIELTDISEEEIKQREAEETRMQEELSRLQLEKLLKKKVRAKK